MKSDFLFKRLDAALFKQTRPLLGAIESVDFANLANSRSIAALIIYSLLEIIKAHRNY